MIIELVRIDDRLIHGQVATSWAKSTHIDRIIVVDDEVAQDELRKVLLKEAAPQGIQASSVSVEKFKRVYDNPKYANDKVILLYTNPTSIIETIKLGVEIKEVNVGNMGFKNGKTKVTNFLFVDEQDVQSLRELEEVYQVSLNNKAMIDSRSDNVLDLLNKAEL